MKDIVAHRGNAAEFRENSIAAIQSAIALGCRFVEFDIQISSDRVPVLMHDGAWFRLKGKDRDSVDISAYGLTSLGFAKLEDVSALLRDHPEVTAFVEIKAEAIDRFGHEEAVRMVAELVDPAQAVIISFDLKACEIARRLGFRIGAVISDISRETQDRCGLLKPEFTFTDHTLIGGAVPWRGTTWVAYEVESTSAAEAVRAKGVTLIETMQVRRFAA